MLQDTIRNGAAAQKKSLEWPVWQFILQQHSMHKAARHYTTAMFQYDCVTVEAKTV